MLHAAAAEQVPPAGGAPLDQIAAIVAFTTLVYGGLLWVMWRERRGRRTALGQAAERIARADGSPRWFALPLSIQVAGAISAAVGLYWDVAFHISHGRDEGPLANPAHYLIFLGLIAIFAGGGLALCLAADPLPRRTLRITRTWRVPLGAAISTGVALCALAGFPLDDVWHRLFGQDVTEWGPTHVLMIGGVVMLPYTMLLTCAEVAQVSAPRSRRAYEWIALVVLAAGPVAFGLEYAYGVPQFPLVNDPIILTVASVVTFGTALMRGRRWLIGAWLGYAALEIALLALNVWVFDSLTPWPPLLLGAVLAGALLSRWARPTVPFGAVMGLAVTGGLLVVEYGWTHATRPMPWPAELVPWAALWCGLAGTAAGVVVVWMHHRLSAVARAEGEGGTVSEETVLTGGRTAPGPLALVAAAVAVGVFAVNVPPATGSPVTATIHVEPTAAGASESRIVVHLDPAGAAEEAYWFEALSWQGGGAVRAALIETAPGVYRTDRPVPVRGDWKTLVRLHRPVHALESVPVYLPGDPAIPAEEVPAVDGAERPFVEERLILRREERHDVPGWLWGTAYAVVGALFLIVVGLVALGYAAAARPSAPKRRTDRASHRTLTGVHR